MGPALDRLRLDAEGRVVLEGRPVTEGELLLFAGETSETRVRCDRAGTLYVYAYTSRGMQRGVRPLADLAAAGCRAERGAWGW